MFQKNTGQDRTIGELREFVAARVTEPVLQSMIDAGKVQVYMKGNAEFVRAVNHTWDDVQGLTFEQTLGGESRGANALEHCSINQLSDLFQNALDDHEQGMDILQPTDQRLQASNCRNLSLWQSGQFGRQIVQTPGPHIADVPSGCLNS